MGAEDTFPVVGEIVKGGLQSGDGADKWDKLFGSQSPAGKDMTEYNRQKEFAQHGIRWRVEDAVRAGLNPEAALGTSGVSYSPSSTFSAGPPSYSDSDRAIDSITAMGQNAFRGLAATMTKEEKAFKQLQLQSLQQDVINKGIQNDILMTRYREMGGPSFPSQENFVPGQGNSDRVQEVPKKSTMSARGSPSHEAGWVPDTGFSRTDKGLYPVVPEGLSESLEDDMIGKGAWHVRNTLGAVLGWAKPPPKNMLPKGYDAWRFNPISGWVPHKLRGKEKGISDTIKNLKRRFYGF